MMIASLSVYSHGSGSIQVSLDSGDCVLINLTDEESDRFRSLASEIFFGRQKSIAKDIETASPALIELKPIPVPSSDIDDDIPF